MQKVLMYLVLVCLMAAPAFGNESLVPSPEALTPHFTPYWGAQPAFEPCASSPAANSAPKAQEDNRHEGIVRKAGTATGKAFGKSGRFIYKKLTLEKIGKGTAKAPGLAYKGASKAFHFLW